MIETTLREILEIQKQTVELLDKILWRIQNIDNKTESKRFNIRKIISKHRGKSVNDTKHNR